MAYLHGDNGCAYNAETFSLRLYAEQIPEEFFATRASRAALTRDDPLLWAVVYVPHLLKNQHGEISFSDVHLGLYRDALELAQAAGQVGFRRAYVAPRGSGKSTTLFVITTLWLACHHPTFVAAFSSSGTQAKDHLAAVRLELSGNRLIREDYPEACSPVLKRNGMPVADSDLMLYTKSGFCFSARGVDTEVLGLVDPLNRRPGVILLDDIEGAEGSYSLFQAEKRLTTLVDGILPMNDRAHVRLVGTVTMPGSIMHGLVNTVVSNEPPPRLVTDEKFQVTYFPPIIERADGTERSVWPARWPMEYLQSIRHTRSFAKNFLNQPAGTDGGYWTSEDITYGEVPAVTRRVLVLDPAVTSKDGSDESGIAVVGFSPADGRAVVERAEGVRLTGEPFRAHLARIIKTHPGKIHGIVIEVNQGGELWDETLGPLGLKVVRVWSGASKAVRFAAALDWYQKPRPMVVHAEKFHALETQMTWFPQVAHDDVVDAVCTGVLWFLSPESLNVQEAVPRRASSTRYR